MPPRGHLVQSASGSRFGQLFVGEGGRVVIVEPKYPTNKDGILFQHQPGEPVYYLGRNPLVELLTQVCEQFGDQLPGNPFALMPLSQLVRQTLTNAGVASLVPAIDQATATYTMANGRSSAANHGIRLDFPA